MSPATRELSTSPRASFLTPQSMVRYRSARNLVGRERAWKTATAFTATVVGATATAFVVLDAPIPRPWFVFGGCALALAVLILGIGRYPPGGLLPCGYVALLAGLLLRFSAFSRVRYSGFDHGRWLRYVQRFLEAGGVVGTDMYSASPLYILHLIVGHGIIGGELHAGRFYTILTACVLPLMIGTLAYRLTDDVEIGYVAGVLGMAGPLFLRTSTLIESEALAVTWFTLAIYLYLRSIRTRSRRFYALFLAVCGTAVVLHFFYGVIVFLTLLFSYGCLTVARRLGVPLGLPDPPVALWFGIIAVGVTTTSWILWSSYAHAGAVTLASATSLSVSGDLVSLFLPTTGAAGAGTGTAGSGPVTTGLTLLPLLGLGLLSLLGFVYLLREWFWDDFGVIGIVSVGFLAVGFAIATPDYNLSFRTYYFVSVFLLVFAAVAIVRESWFPAGGYRSLLTLVVIALVAVYVLLAPVSPIANNTDPRFGGNPWAVTETDDEQLTLLDERLGGSDTIHNRLEQVHPFLLPRVSNPALFITDGTCGGNVTVSDVGRYRVCEHLGGSLATNRSGSIPR